MKPSAWLSFSFLPLYFLELSSTCFLFNFHVVNSLKLTHRIKWIGWNEPNVLLVESLQERGPLHKMGAFLEHKLVTTVKGSYLIVFQ